MSDFRISIPGGEARRLKTGGKYCPSDILVEAIGGSGGNGGSDLPDAETKAFGMKTTGSGRSWIKIGYQGEGGYTDIPSITGDMKDGHPYLILLNYESGDTFVTEIVATESPLFLNPSDGILYTAEPSDNVLYVADYGSGTWQMTTVVENHNGAVPVSLLVWSNYDIQLAAEFGGGDSGWIGYEPIEIELIENGELAPVDAEYRITGAMLNQLAAGLQMKTGFQNMLTPAEMRGRIDSTSMFRFTSSASGYLV